MKNDNNPNEIKIGASYQGGIIFHIFEKDDPGYVEGEVHGLIAAKEDQAKEDQATGAEWGCHGTAIPGADKKYIGSGADNTRRILAGCNEDGIAAKIAADYIVVEDGITYDNWFLPSIDELEKFIVILFDLGAFEEYMYDSVSYWSSTQEKGVAFIGGSDWALYFGFDVNHFYVDEDGHRGSMEKKYKLNVRAIRAF
jgi:hypothetical protein